MTRLTIAGAVLVLAIVFGFIFWTQFSSNQQQLAGNSSHVTKTSNNTSANSANSSTPASDNVSSIETDLSGVTVTDIDSDSAQFNSELNGF